MPLPFNFPDVKEKEMNSNPRNQMTDRDVTGLEDELFRAISDRTKKIIVDLENLDCISSDDFYKLLYLNPASSIWSKSDYGFTGI
jgi:hypothetical protein